MQCKHVNLGKTESNTFHETENKLKREDFINTEVRFTNLGKFVKDNNGSRQGAAIYGNYLVQAYHPAMYSIFDLSSKTIQKSGKLQRAADNNHANNICFSNRFFDKGDQFPLLYVSENHTLDISVNRITSLDKDPELVQRITLPEKIGHYLNAVFDFEQRYIYTICFRDKNWRTNENGNHIVVSKLRLPDIDEGNIVIEDIIEQFDLPFRTATQGAFFIDGLIVHGFGINTNDDDGLLVVDTKEKKILRDIKTHEIFKDEIEGVCPYGEGIAVTLQRGDVYLVEFE